MVRWITFKKKQPQNEKEAVSATVSQKSKPDKGSVKRKPGVSKPRTRQKTEGGKEATRKMTVEHKPVERKPMERKPVTHKKEDHETARKADANKNWSLDNFKIKPQDGKTRFHDLDLPLELMHAVADLKFEYCMPIQAEILPSILNGKNAAGQAQTGTGKTAAFLLGIFTRMLRNPLEKKPRNGTPRALIVVPTRELVVQIKRDADALTKYTPFTTMAVYGGLNYAKQEAQLRDKRIDLVAATPGRLIDYLRKRSIHLSHVEYLVLDEADRMLDMGFIPDVRRIVQATPPKGKRQTMLFSATLDEKVINLSKSWMDDPVHIEIEPEHIAAESVDQKVYIITAKKKYALLYNILKQEKPKRAIIFANRRDGVRRVTRKLRAHGFKCNMLSGEIPQNRRMRTLDDFRAGKFNIMIATDVAGRGLHIDGVSHIINYNIPHDAEDYIHRIGRTGRAGCEGISITFACEEESFYLPAIEELLGQDLSCIQPEDEWLSAPPKVAVRSPRKKHSGSGSGRGRARDRRRR